MENYQATSISQHKLLGGIITGALALLVAGITPVSAATSVLQSDVNNIQAAGPSSVVAQINQNGSVQNAVAGTAQLGTNNPVSTNTHYRTGSVTKTFVSTVILQLVGEGKLSLDDTVDHWLPGVITGNGNDGKQITVRQILNHTAGLYDYIEDPGFLATISTPDEFYANNMHRYTPQDLLNIALSHKPNFAPGTSWSYSNTDYIVAGQIIKAVTGNTWDVEVANRIVKPLGLKDTTIPGNVATLPSPFAHAYNIYNGNPRTYTDTTVDNMSWADAAGAIITTTTDENKFFSALLSGKVLAPAQLAQMETTVPISSKTGYGLGIAHSTLCNTDIWWHNGGTIGYSTMVASTPNGSTTVAYDLSTTDLLGADTAFDNNIKGPTNSLMRHAFCGANSSSTDNITDQEDVVNGNHKIK
ncbi:MAG: serine hydrolase domain-containing protein [Candidatus Levyibacteriota bacterium]